MASSARSRITPWIYTIGSSIIVSIIGTFTYRLGAAYAIPYGLFLSLIVLAISCFFSGIRGNMWHECVHASLSTIIVWYLALQGTISSTLMAMGGAALTNYWSHYASAYWLYGIMVVQIAVMFIPRRWLAYLRDDEVIDIDEVVPTA